LENLISPVSLRGCYRDEKNPVGSIAGVGNGVFFIVMIISVTFRKGFLVTPDPIRLMSNESATRASQGGSVE